MAKKKRKKHGKKKSGHRKSRKRSTAAKRNYKKSGLYKFNMRRKKSGGGKRKKKYGKKKSRGGKGKHKRYARAKHKFHGGAIAARARFNNLVKRFEARGHDHATAVGLANRAARIGAAMGRGAKKYASAKAAENRALANLFGGIGAAGHLAAMQRA